MVNFIGTFEVLASVYNPVFSVMFSCQLFPFSPLVYFGVLIKCSLSWPS